MRVAVCDSETDPFKYGRVPKPFTWGFYDGETYTDFWPAYDGEDMAKVFVNFLKSLSEPHLIYAHNGGRFDFYFLLNYADGAIRIVNGRILEMKIGIHTFRDSYAIMPIPLAAYEKDSIDYTCMEADVRGKYKDEILKYQKSDCIYLYELVTEFKKEFGDVLTIGTASMKQFANFHKVARGSSAFDERHRVFYFGGRCQCFKTGIIKGKLKVYDVNSMYPSVMRDFKHPVSVSGYVSKSIGPNTAFVIWEGNNYGAVPIRTKFGLDFNCEQGKFYTTIHEFNAGLDTGTIRPRTIVAAYDFEEQVSFENFVDHFYHSRLRAKEAGDKFRDIFYKLILNSSYGKQAQDPTDFKDWFLSDSDTMMDEPWAIEMMAQSYILWTRDAGSKSYYNVATAASITGAARAQLLRGIANAHNPIYCDTDSIICEALHENVDAKKLGAWKLEAEGTHMAVAGKKLYAFFDGEKCIKQASKGSHLSPEEIVRVAKGDVVRYEIPVPAFKLDGKHQFIARDIRRTGTIEIATS